MCPQELPVKPQTPHVKEGPAVSTGGGASGKRTTSLEVDPRQNTRGRGLTTASEEPGLQGPGQSHTSRFGARTAPGGNREVGLRGGMASVTREETSSGHKCENAAGRGVRPCPRATAPRHRRPRGPNACPLGLEASRVVPRRPRGRVPPAPLPGSGGCWSS